MNKGLHAVREEDGKLMEDLIMELILGRPLRPFEYVEHINGDTLDNREENLYLRDMVSESWLNGDG
jgi:hypothetical protein